MSRNPSKAWFAPKRYGYGSGLPIAWQGWVVLVTYLLITTGAATALPLMFHDTAISVFATLAVVGVATVILMIICIKKTDGGWRWRQ